MQYILKSMVLQCILVMWRLAPVCTLPVRICWDHTPRGRSHGERVPLEDTCRHGLINYIDTKGKCRRLKKCTCYGTLRQVFSCLRPPPPYEPRTHTTPLTHCIRVYCTVQYTRSHKEGEEGGELTREKVRGEPDHKAGSERPTWLTVLPVYELW
jgi:hypothetical protein